MDTQDPAARSSAKFARTSYGPRVIGLTMGFVALASVLAENGAPWWFWVGPALHAFVWPHLAWQYARRHATPVACELRNLQIDHFAGGLWLPAIDFNLLPSALTVSMMSMDSMIGGGARQLGRGLLAQAAGVLAGLLVFGLRWQPAPSLQTVVACLPLLLLHPFSVGLVTHRSLRRLRRQRAELAYQNQRDGLSDLFNRHHWEQKVKTEFARFARSGQTASLVLIDLDHFKRINDVYGHDIGDQVIRRFAKLLRSCLREADVPGRYGGEEFGLLLPQTSPQEASAVMDRLRRQLHEQALVDGVEVTASFGVAGLSRDLENHEAWMRLADQMLYRAKHRGRDQISMAGDSRPSSLEPPAAPHAPKPPHWRHQRGPKSLSRVLSMLGNGKSAIALFDPADQMVLANALFLQIHDVQADARFFSDIVRHCYAQRIGPYIDTDDIEAWLSMADTKRRSRAYRSFVVDLCDRSLLRVNETSFENGWLLYVATPT
ncbi:diguanylate cyclase [Pseudorhodoferax sp.]|uniref:diguanylate cyclase n=1 Tax=Pseudorhodoferax sp. TaxID=1993553 RepID=UPI0039E6B1CC